MTIERHDPTDEGRYYWRAVTYDHIDLKGWTETNPTTIVRQPDTQLFEGLADASIPRGCILHVHGDVGRLPRADDRVTRDPSGGRRDDPPDLRRPHRVLRDARNGTAALGHIRSRR